MVTKQMIVKQELPIENPHICCFSIMKGMWRTEDLWDLTSQTAAKNLQAFHNSCLPLQNQTQAFFLELAPWNWSKNELCMDIKASPPSNKSEKTSRSVRDTTLGPCLPP